MCSYSATLDQSDYKCILDKKKRSTPIVPDSARSSPGFFSLQLANGIDIRLTSTDHAALHSYTYPPASNLQSSIHYARYSKDNATALHSPVLLLDLTSDLQNSFSGEGKLIILLDKINNIATLKGSGQFRPSFGDGTFQIHMCASVSHVKRIGIYEGSELKDNLLTKEGDYFPGNMGALIELDEKSLEMGNRTLQTRVGVSWKSREQACRYAQEEIPDWQQEEAFERVRLANRARWNLVMGETFKPSLKGVKLKQRVR